ncbi:MAG: DUF5777 family beta-barrel protein [Bacteroidia bacterium]
MNYRPILFMLSLFLLSNIQLYGQEDLMQMLEEEEEEETVYTYATFKSTRVVNAHSLENVGGGVLDFRISHRFGRVNSGAYEFFGLDGAQIRLGLEYGLTDWLMVGVGRSSFEKTYDGFVKGKLLRQSTGKKTMPISLSWFSSIAVKTIRWPEPDRENYFSSRLDFTHQIIFGRKVNENFSFQISPTLVHRNLVENTQLQNDVFAIGIAARQKLTPSVSLNAEYWYVLPDQIADNKTQSLSFGFDIETGGHVFQLHFTNSPGMIERGFITETEGDWLLGDIHFGFNISRVFTLVSEK